MLTGSHQLSPHYFSGFECFGCEIRTPSQQCLRAECDPHTHSLGSNSPYKGFPSASVVKNPSADAGDARDVCSIPGSGRPPGEGNGNPLQYSCLGDPVNRGAWLGYSPWGHKKSQKQLSD